MCADTQSPADGSGHLPVEAWARDITRVCEDIEQLGLQIVSTHRGAGEDAERTSRGWKLAERQSAEREALGTVVECVGRICEALEAAGRESSPDARRAAAQSIAEGLPDLERSFLIARRAALDLLLWTRREGHLEGSELPDKDLKVAFLEALAELEDNECHRRRQFPKTRLHRVTGVKQAIYRADITKISGWRIHLQYENGQIVLKDVIEGRRHDDVVKVIKSKKGRYL